MKALLGLLLVIGILLFGNQPLAAQTWVQTMAPVTNWSSVVCSADGVKMAAVTIGGALFTSTNSGATWNQSTNAPTTNNIQQGFGAPRIASSADGSKLVATVYGGRIYQSVDAGSTWIQTSAPSNNWVGIVSSADGNKLTALAAVFPPPNFYTSSDGGNTWQTNASPYDRWGDLACSADGNTVFACGGIGTLLVSTNFCHSWTTNSLVTESQSAASSADGSRLLVVSGPGALYVSTNFGLSWVLINTPKISRIASSADGSRLGAVNNLTPWLGISTNFGAAWTPTNIPPGTSITWGVKPVALAADGNELVAAVNGGGIWISQTAPSPQMKIIPVGGTILLSWLIPSANFVLEQNSNLTTPNWSIVTNIPAWNLANLHDEVTLPLAGGTTFYRLVSP
ncbi:MAG TPA: hypothetical protein VMH87_05380 [Pseudomonadales bacterium]|nr:hypothetical protein [Pseudomonadales bacterium]